MNATDTPPCPDCGGQLVEHGPDDDSSTNAYDCPACGWGLQECAEPLTLASAPWTRALWCEVEIARRMRPHGAPTPAQLAELQRLGWSPGEGNPVSWAVASVARLSRVLAVERGDQSAAPEGKDVKWRMEIAWPE